VVSLTKRQWAALVALTLFWGLNWPVMKTAVTGYPPLAFRSLSMLLGLPCLALGLIWFKAPFRVARRDWPVLLGLAVTNMVAWHVLLMIALPSLSSGRAAILGYTMPVFSALWGWWRYGDRLAAPHIAGVVAAGVAVLLLLWHELASLGGAPLAAFWLVLASAIWALGTQQLRRTRIDAPTLTIAFWMTAITTVVVCTLSLVFEADRWRWPSQTVNLAVLYNAVLIFGFCHAAWFSLARVLPPVASSVSICLIPVLGLAAGAYWLQEQLHWQDALAVCLIVLAIVLVLRPAARTPRI
jgi:drug/metabolite transporter (DMT)-like permease